MAGRNPQKRPKQPRGSRRPKSEVSCVIKYLVFGFNVFFWVCGSDSQQNLLYISMKSLFSPQIKFGCKCNKIF